MANLPGRDRRRRVLKDEVLSASSNYAHLRANDEISAADAPRYSDAAGVENHPQVTDFIPRRYATVALLIGFGAGATTALAAAQLFVAPLLAGRGIRGGEAFQFAADGSLAAWLSAIVLLVTSAICLLIYSLRRHRIDDFRGRYRVWLGASAACLLLSANSVAGFHQIAADALGQLVGWSALRDGAAWWLLIAGVPLTWIGLRALLDLRECRVAAAMFVAATACFFASAAAYLGFVTIADLQSRSIASGSALLFGHWLGLAAVISYARFVVLDAQGLIATRRRPSQAKRQSKTETSNAPRDTSTLAANKTAVASTTSYSRPTLATIQPAKTPADSNRWVDGSRPERDRYKDESDDDDGPDGDRKLSKSDRKRMRKLKTEGRAA